MLSVQRIMKDLPQRSYKTAKKVTQNVPTQATKNEQAAYNYMTLSTVSPQHPIYLNRETRRLLDKLKIKA